MKKVSPKKFLFTEEYLKYEKQLLKEINKIRKSFNVKPFSKMPNEVYDHVLTEDYDMIAKTLFPETTAIMNLKCHLAENSYQEPISFIPNVKIDRNLFDHFICDIFNGEIIIDEEDLKKHNKRIKKYEEYSQLNREQLLLKLANKSYAKTGTESLIDILIEQDEDWD